MSTPVPAPPPLLIPSDVAKLLGVRMQDLTWWIYGYRRGKRYRRFEIARHNSDENREIHAPIKPIKAMQRTLADELSACYEPPSHVHGFVIGRSPVSNAKRHPGQEWVLRADIKHFFPSINFGRVRGLFMAFPFEYPADVATLLAQLCCHENQLPQGAPTSPVISNYICRRMDTQLAHLARAERCYYTRYADDLCFSTNRRTFPSVLASLDAGVATVGPALAEIVTANGFAVNGEKTRLMQATQRQRVTGLVVNEKVNIPRNYTQSLRNLLFIWNRYGEAAAIESFSRANKVDNWPPTKPGPDFKKAIRGRVQYVGSVKGWTSPVYQALAVSLREADAAFQPRPWVLQTPQEVMIFVEGETDALHFQAASRYFANRGDFPLLRLTFPPRAHAGSDSQLLQRCRTLAAMAPHHPPHICVFDRDNPVVLREAVDPNGQKDWGSNVAAVAIVAPPWRAPGAPLCIEMLYDDDTLARPDADGRRVYLSSEFDARTGLDADRNLTTPNPQRKTLVREEVYDISTGASVALTKMAFATYIADAQAPFGHVSFEGFRPTFEVIQDVATRFTRPRPVPPATP